MIRALTILAAIAALAVSAAPASAGTSKAKVPHPGVASFSIDIGTSERLDLNSAPKRVKDGTSNTLVAFVANHTEGTISIRRPAAPKQDKLLDMHMEI
jgi:hypothetical protein